MSNPNPKPRVPTNPVPRFYAKVQIPKDISQCWLWTGFQNKAGYGQLRVAGKLHLVHRFSYVLHKEPIPKGRLVLHQCDTRNCVNPDHLFLGTQEDNKRDCVVKGRQPHRLSQEAIDQIRSRRVAGEKLASIAADFQVGPDYICRICLARRRVIKMN